MFFLTYIFEIILYILPLVLTQKAEDGVGTTTDTVTEETLVTDTKKTTTPETETAVVTNATFMTTTTTRRPSAGEYDANLWCKLQANQFDCNKFGKKRYMFYYDMRLEDCKTFTYGGCPEALNMFRTITECHDTCRDVPKSYYADLPPAIYCLLQPDFGNCNDYNPMFYFDVSSGQCKGFSYSGCGGNQNKFKNVQECTTVCAVIIESLLQ